MIYCPIHYNIIQRFEFITFINLIFKIFHLLFRTCGHHHAAIILFSLYEARALEEAENVFCTHIDTYVET